MRLVRRPDYEKRNRWIFDMRRTEHFDQSTSEINDWILIQISYALPHRKLAILDAIVYRNEDESAISETSLLNCSGPLFHVWPTQREKRSPAWFTLSTSVVSRNVFLGKLHALLTLGSFFKSGWGKKADPLPCPSVTCFIARYLIVTTRLTMAIPSINDSSCVKPARWYLLYGQWAECRG
nr:hypothetical protein CFP56_19440 [Quercus suber]